MPVVNYPALRFLEQHGMKLALLLSLCPLFGALYVTANGWSTYWLIGGLAAGGVLYLLGGSYVELVRVIIDMMLPK